MIGSSSDMIRSVQLAPSEVHEEAEHRSAIMAIILGLYFADLW